jgi:uncharacterized membrane protein
MMLAWDGHPQIRARKCLLCTNAIVHRATGHRIKIDTSSLTNLPKSYKIVVYCCGVATLSHKFTRAVAQDMSIQRRSISEHVMREEITAMKMRFIERTSTWLSTRGLTEEEYVERVRKGQRRLRRVRILLFAGVVFGVILSIGIVKLAFFAGSSLNSETEATLFTIAFNFGGVFGAVLCAVLMCFLFALRGPLGNRSDTLMLKFYDELKRR